MKNKIKFLSLILCLSAFFSQAQNKLLPNFQNPPNAAKPRVWWHWMNGNITQEGIQKDLEWMSRIGIGGFQNFDASLGTPQIVKERLTYMTPKWKEAFKFTTNLADKLGLEMAIAASPGWSVTGGPWVPAKDGMKKYVWSEIRVKGGQPFTGTLPKPPSTTGKFQDLPNESGMGSGVVSKLPTYYQDISTIAYKIPDSEIALLDINPTITSSGGSFTLAQLSDGNLAVTKMLPSDTAKGYAWIQYNFAKPQTIKAITVVGGGDKGPFGLFGDLKEARSLEISDDGIMFKRICFIPAGNLLQQTISIPETKALFFRITFKNPPTLPNLGAIFGRPSSAPKPPLGTEIAELVLHTSTRINSFEEKAGFSTSPETGSFLTPQANDFIKDNEVVDLTSKVKADGTLDWNVPVGNWMILRFGYSLTGHENHPASPEATGLEVDKLDKTAVKNYLENYLDQYKEATGGLMGKKGLQFMVTDSYEAGSANWTQNMASEFSKRRGYDMKKWMPVLTGRIVKSSEESEHFLWDFRKTLSELVVENHYDQIGDLLHQRGMGRYTESHEDKRVLVADGMEIKRKADIPMSAMWTPGSLGRGNEESTGYKADIRESASVAHIYGQNLVAAESMTALGNSWAYSPERLKRTADMEMAMGLNRFVIHTSVHQPSDDKIPGLGLGPFGQWFTRHETWAEQAKPWTSYLSRSCYMLQQGKMVADILYFYGEDNNITSLFKDKLPNIPTGYNYDFINSDALINVLTVLNGKLETPSGMQYRVLVLDENAKKMSLSVIKKIRDLVRAGATVTGIKPEMTPSLSDNVEEFRAIVKDVWESNYKNVSINLMKISTIQSLEMLLQKMKIEPDFTYSKPHPNTEVLYVHRKLADQDIYWVNNRNDQIEDVEVSIRISGKVAELWNPQTGETKKISYKIENGRTVIPLHLEPWDAFFVVFRDIAKTISFTVPKVTEKQVLQIEKPWIVSFQAGRGVVGNATFNTLQSLSENADNNIKYFSGTATYKTSFTVQVLEKGIYEIDLGEVKNLAEVIINGKSLGILWKKPFKIELKDALKMGENTLEIKVTNLWVNRLIGDQQPDVKTKISYTTMPFYKADSPLLPSGLMGPVKVLVKQ